MTTARKNGSDYGATGDDIDAYRAATAELRLLKAQLRAGERLWKEDLHRELRYAVAETRYLIGNELPGHAMHHLELFTAGDAKTSTPERDEPLVAFAIEMLLGGLRPLRELVAKLKETPSAKGV